MLKLPIKYNFNFDNTIVVTRQLIQKMSNRSAPRYTHVFIIQTRIFVALQWGFFCQLYDLLKIVDTCSGI